MLVQKIAIRYQILPPAIPMGAPRDVGRRPSINLEGSLRNSAVFPHWEQTGVPSVLNASNLYNERTHTEMMREGEKRGSERDRQREV